MSAPAPALVYLCPDCGQMSGRDDALTHTETDWLDGMHDRPATRVTYAVTTCPRCRTELADDCLVALCEAGCGAVAQPGDDFCAGCRAAWDAEEFALYNEHGEQAREVVRVTADPAPKAGADPAGCDRPAGIFTGAQTDRRRDFIHDERINHILEGAI